MLRNDTTELIVRHELTHLHHLDFLWSLCRTIALIVYWWNPLIWLAAICSKRDAELACDEAVAAGLVPEQRIAYARVILAQAPRKKAALSLAGPPVKERILFLTKKQKTSILCIVLALALTISATGCSFAELTRRKTNAPASSTEEAQPKTEPQAEAAPEPTAEITQPGAHIAGRRTFSRRDRAGGVVRLCGPVAAGLSTGLFARRGTCIDIGISDVGLFAEYGRAEGTGQHDKGVC